MQIILFIRTMGGGGDACGGGDGVAEAPEWWVVGRSTASTPIGPIDVSLPIGLKASGRNLNCEPEPSL